MIIRNKEMYVNKGGLKYDLFRMYPETVRCSAVLTARKVASKPTYCSFDEVESYRYLEYNTPSDIRAIVISVKDMTLKEVRRRIGESSIVKPNFLVKDTTGGGSEVQAIWFLSNVVHKSDIPSEQAPDRSCSKLEHVAYFLATSIDATATICWRYGVNILSSDPHVIVNEWSHRLNYLSVLETRLTEQKGRNFADTLKKRMCVFYNKCTLTGEEWAEYVIQKALKLRESYAEVTEDAARETAESIARWIDLRFGDSRGRTLKGGEFLCHGVSVDRETRSRNGHNSNSMLGLKMHNQKRAEDAGMRTAEVYRLHKDGYTVAEIAERLDVCQRTVRNHLRREKEIDTIMAKCVQEETVSIPDDEKETGGREGETVSVTGECGKTTLSSCTYHCIRGFITRLGELLSLYDRLGFSEDRKKALTEDLPCLDDVRKWLDRTSYMAFSV